MSGEFDAVIEAVSGASLHGRSGTVLRSSGEMVTVSGVNFRPHEIGYLESVSGQTLAAQCSGSNGRDTQLALLDRGSVAVGSRVVASGHLASVPVGRGLLGRVIDGLGRPMDGGPSLGWSRTVTVAAEPPHPLQREPIHAALPSGVRAIDGFLTLGRGQRVGIFAGSGVGKSTLLGMLARGTAADVTVIALIGERGREVRDFIEHDLGVEALKNCIIVASTGDNPAAMRLCAAQGATAVAEALRDEGLDVLLLFDSLTRVAMAQREIGLAAGEPPATRGYPPSVFSMLPHLMERAGPAARGSITAIYTILVDGDDMDEPIADISRATLDGHIVLKRSLASAGHYPPIDVLGSVSRLMSRVVSPEHAANATHIRSLLAAYEDARDLISIGAYVRGADDATDRALDVLPNINDFLRQPPDDVTGFDDAVARLIAIDPRAAAQRPDIDPGDIAQGEIIDGAYTTATEAVGSAS